MRTLLAAMVGVVLLPATISNPEGRKPPTVLLERTMLSEVHLQSGSDTLVVQRPAHAREFALGGVFVVDKAGVAGRAWVRYGRASGSLIQVESGAAAGDRIIVADMQAWDAFDRLLVRLR